MITLKILEWSNFFSYGKDNKLPLNDDSLTQLVGINGRGKSSIPLIIEEILFNKNSKGIKKGDILNRNIDSNKYSGKLTFSVYSDEYTVEVTRTGATQKVKLIKNNEDISSHTATDTFKQIESILGLDAKTFSQVVYQNNTSSLQFLTATDTNRKKFLIDLLNLDKYVKLFEVIKVSHKEIADTIISVDSRYKVISSWLNTHRKQDLTIKEIQAVPEFDSSKSIKLNKLKQDLDNIVSINKQISQNEQYKLIRNSIELPITTLKEINTNPLVQKLGELKQEIKTHQDIVNKFNKLTSESKCHTCGQPIDTENANLIIAANEKEIEKSKLLETSIKNEYEEALKNNILVKEHQRLIQEFEKYSGLIDNSLESIIKDKLELELEVRNLTDEIKKEKDAVQLIQNQNDEIIKHNSKVSTILEQLSKFEEELESLSIELINLNEKLSILEVLKKAFSTNGLLAYKIENSVKDLEVLTNEYLTELSDGRFQLNFSINNDKLNVIIIDNGVDISISALSSGELARVTTSTLLAIRKLMSSLAKSRINVLFLDETIDTLDIFGKEKLIEVLLKEEYLNTFLISHGYTHPLIKKLTVIKEDNISRIEEE